MLRLLIKQRKIRMKKFILSIILITLLIASPAGAEFFSDIIVTSPNAIWTDSRAYNTLNDAIAAVGANERTIKIVSPQVVTTLTIPSNVNLEFDRNGSITNSGLLTINTKNIKAPNRQIFTGVGAIDFATGSTVKTGWFSNIETAFALTANDTVTLIVSKPQTITASYSPGNNVHLKWEDPGNILTVNAGRTVGNLKNIEAGNYQLFAGAGDFDFLDGTELKLNWFNRLESVLIWVEDEEVTITVNEDSIVQTTVASTVNERVKVVPGGQLIPDAGVTLTIGSFEAGLYQVFSGAGSVDFGVNAINEVYPEWWKSNIIPGTTDMSIAIHKAIMAASGIPVIFSGTYLSETLASTDITISEVILCGRGNAIIDGNNNAGSGFIIATNMTKLYISGIKFYRFGNVAGVISIDVTTRILNDIKINNNQIIDSVNGFNLNAAVTNAEYVSNTFNNLSSSNNVIAIQSGMNGYAVQDNTGKHIIERNIFKDIISTGVGYESHAIRIFGKEAVVKNNIIDTVENGGGSNSEGIYVKIRYGIIAGNIITNGGNGEASINIKGDRRAESANTQGYIIDAHDNIIRSTNIAHTVAIRIQTDDVSVHNNWIEGSFTTKGIASSQGNNVSITNNQFVNITSQYGIFVRSSGLAPKINNNKFYGIIGTASVATSVIYASGISNDMEIKGNTIEDDSNYVGNGLFCGIHIYTQDGIFNRLNISNNKVKLIEAGISIRAFYIYNPTNAINGLTMHGNEALVSGGITYPFYLGGLGLITDFDISRNKFYGIVDFTSTGAVETYHTDTVYTNASATGIVTINLPTAELALKYTMIRSASYAFRANPHAAELIRGGGAGKYLELDTDGDNVVLECFTTGIWDIVGGHGTHTYEL